MPDFFQEFFANRIIDTSAGYGFIDTVVYAIIALCIAFFVIYPIFNKLKVKFNFKFALALLPYLLLGSASRVIKDLYESNTLRPEHLQFFQSIGVFPTQANPLSISFYAQTPGVYIAVGVFAILALLFSIFLEKKFKISSLKVFAGIGIAAALPFVVFDLLYFQNFVKFSGFLLVAFFVALAFAITYYVLKFLKIRLLEDNLNKLVLSGQLLDGFATATAIQFFGFGEQHVVSSVITDAVPFLFPAIKLFVVLLILHYADKELKNENLRGFVKVLILVFGLAPGLRDWITLAAGG